MFRKLAVAGAFALSALAPGAALAAPAVPPFEERAQLFAYDPSGLAITVFGVEDRTAAKVYDIVYDTAGGPAVSAYVVVPKPGPPEAGVLMAHWLSGHANANRTEFLGDALTLAKRGAASILPSGFFPWVPNPEGDETDTARIRSEVVMQRRALDVLAEFGVTGPFAVVGHDYGGMYGSITAAVDPRVDAEVLMAIDATFSNWFDRFWLGLEGAEEDAYEALLAPYDPVNYVDHAPAGGVLFQWSGHDFFIPAAVRDQVVAAAAGGPVQSLVYANAGHQLNGAARRDRLAFLTSVLGLG